MQQSASGNIDPNNGNMADKETLKELMHLWEASLKSENKEA
jgi:hypothetical protein